MAIHIGDKHIVLVGMMGTGKTVVGRTLARRMERPFYDTDRLIEERKGQTIAKIFSAHGEAYFREIESAVIREAVAKPPAVIATGGGALQRQENRDALKRRGMLVWLTADVHEMVQRTSKRAKTRPLLRGQDTASHLRQLLAEREPFYAEAAFVVDTTDKNVNEVTAMIMKKIEGGQMVRQEER